MATGRTVGSRFTRAYVDGYDMSGYARSVGELSWGFTPNEGAVLDDAVIGAYPGQCTISIGDINGVMDNRADGMHDEFASASDAVRDVMIPIGIRAAPADGDPVFCAQVAQNAYQASVADEMLTVNMDLGSWDERAGSTGSYPIPWGYVIHAKGAETGVNAGSAGTTGGGQTTGGGFMMYQLFGASTGTITLKIEDSTGGAWSELVSSGVLTQTSTGQSGIVALAEGGTVDTDLRWQLVLGTATTTTFALAFVRGR